MPIPTGKSNADEPAGAERAELLRFVQSLSAAELLGAVRRLPIELLRQLHDAFGTHDCNCQVEIVPCGCAGPCDCHAIVQQCPHATSPHDYTLPAEVEGVILARLDPDRFAGPIAIPKPSLVRSREAMAVIREQRVDRGEQLWHPSDLIHFEMPAVGRVVARARNGSLRLGPLRRIDNAGSCNDAGPAGTEGPRTARNGDRDG